MTDDDLKAVLAKYQQKAFELFNQNIVLETQIEQLNKTIEQLQKPKKTTTKSEDFQ